MKEKKTMAELEFGKDVDDIEEPVLIPEGWKVFELMDEPKTEKNNAMKEQERSGEENPDAGFNWSLRLATTDGEAMYNGRTFFLRFPIPKEADKDAYDSRGKKIYDAKMERITGFVSAFGGYVAGRRVELLKGAKGMCYVLQQISKFGASLGQPENQIDIFNQGFKKVGSGEGGGEASEDDASF